MAKKLFYVGTITYIIGLTGVLGTIATYRSRLPEKPRDMIRIEEINKELKKSPFSDISLEDITEKEIGISDIFSES